MNSNPRTLLRACWSPLVKRAAQAYVAGPELADALQVCSSLSRQGIASTLGYWNREGERPRQVAEVYLTALATLSGKGPDCYLSIKAWSLGFAGDLLAEVLEHGRQDGVRIHFDSRGPETADQTFSLISALLPRSPQLSCTIPGRWRRSLRDADLAVELGLSVRVVKGEWGDLDEPDDLDLRAGFLALVDRLAGRACHVAVATHDPSLACEALRRLQAARTPCTLELLFGFPVRPGLRVARG
ncbi:MAG TPA: proline dehydrogenase, partial [Candidatus Binatia bacterium]|nr:proline dehydrogenase [Candidatus Binatia bacterium]